METVPTTVDKSTTSLRASSIFLVLSSPFQGLSYFNWQFSKFKVVVFSSQVWHKTKYWIIRNNVSMLENKWCEIVNCFIEFKFCRVDYYFFLKFFLCVFAVLRIKRKSFWLILILFCKMKKKMMWLMVQCIYDYSNIVKFYCKNLIWINLHVHVYEHNQCRDFLHNIPVFTKVYC